MSGPGFKSGAFLDQAVPELGFLGGFQFGGQNPAVLKDNFFNIKIQKAAFFNQAVLEVNPPALKAGPGTAVKAALFYGNLA